MHLCVRVFSHVPRRVSIALVVTSHTYESIAIQVPDFGSRQIFFSIARWAQQPTNHDRRQLPLTTFADDFRRTFLTRAERGLHDIYFCRRFAANVQ